VLVDELGAPEAQFHVATFLTVDTREVNVTPIATTSRRIREQTTRCIRFRTSSGRICSNGDRRTKTLYNGNSRCITFEPTYDKRGKATGKVGGCMGPS